LPLSAKFLVASLIISSPPENYQTAHLADLQKLFSAMRNFPARVSHIADHAHLATLFAVGIVEFDFDFAFGALGH
jgi:hypothetical protein